jgi:hypothetical protein
VHEVRAFKKSDWPALREHLRQGGTVDEFTNRLSQIEVNIFPTREFKDREDFNDSVFCLWLFLGRLNFRVGPNDRDKFFKFRRQNKKKDERAGMSALLRLLSDSVDKDPDLDEETRELLLALLDDELPRFSLKVQCFRGRPPKIPEDAIRIAMQKELAAGGNLESAYAAAKEQLGVSRSRAQQIAKKHRLKKSPKATKPA